MGSDPLTSHFPPPRDESVKSWGQTPSLHTFLGRACVASVRATVGALKDDDTRTRPRRPGDGPSTAGDGGPRGLYLRLVFSEPRQPLDDDTLDAVVWLDVGRRVVGRGPDGERDVAIPWDAWSSRRHAAVSMFHFGEDRAVLVEDLSSSNGTFVDGVRVAPGAQAVARVGQVVRIGSTLFVIGEGPRSGPPAALPPGWHARSPAMAELWTRARSIAASDDPALLLGEPGTGKTRLARLLHEASARAGGPFVPMNASAIPLHLEEATLFGVASGFIPSVKRKDGLLTLARGGTLFLDELADMSAPAQAKLLDAFDPLHRSYLPVGASARQPTECRLVCATNRDVFALASRGELRQDLLSRLAVGQLRVPPLRERREDILPMYWAASAGLDAKRSALSAEAAEALLLARWTENVRGLESLVRRVAHGLALTPESIREHADRGAAVQEAAAPVARPEPVTAPRPAAPIAVRPVPAPDPTPTELRWPPTPRE
ncbi:MAG: FHA domain-containing protein, partial [Deltaproteobacteria bacterium]